MPQDSASVMYLLTVPLYKSSFRSIDWFDYPSRWRRNACLILFISLHLPAMARSVLWLSCKVNKQVGGYAPNFVVIVEVKDGAYEPMGPEEVMEV